MPGLFTHLNLLDFKLAYGGAAPPVDFLLFFCPPMESLDGLKGAEL